MGGNGPHLKPSGRRRFWRRHRPAGRNLGRVDKRPTSPAGVSSTRTASACEEHAGRGKQGVRRDGLRNLGSASGGGSRSQGHPARRLAPAPAKRSAAQCRGECRAGLAAEGAAKGCLVVASQRASRSGSAQFLSQHAATTLVTARRNLVVVGREPGVAWKGMRGLRPEVTLESTSTGMGRANSAMHEAAFLTIAPLGSLQ